MYLLTFLVFKYYVFQFVMKLKNLAQYILPSMYLILRLAQTSPSRTSQQSTALTAPRVHPCSRCAIFPALADCIS